MIRNVYENEIYFILLHLDMLEFKGICGFVCNIMPFICPTPVNVEHAARIERSRQQLSVIAAGHFGFHICKHLLPQCNTCKYSTDNACNVSDTLSRIRGSHSLM